MEMTQWCVWRWQQIALKSHSSNSFHKRPWSASGQGGGRVAMPFLWMHMCICMLPYIYSSSWLCGFFWQYAKTWHLCYPCAHWWSRSSGQGDSWGRRLQNCKNHHRPRPKDERLNTLTLSLSCPAMFFSSSHKVNKLPKWQERGACRKLQSWPTLWLLSIQGAAPCCIVISIISLFAVSLGWQCVFVPLCVQGMKRSGIRRTSGSPSSCPALIRWMFVWSGCSKSKKNGQDGRETGLHLSILWSEEQLWSFVNSPLRTNIHVSWSTAAVYWLSFDVFLLCVTLMVPMSFRQKCFPFFSLYRAESWDWGRCGVSAAPHRQIWMLHWLLCILSDIFLNSVPTLLRSMLHRVIILNNMFVLASEKCILGTAGIIKVSKIRN